MAGDEERRVLTEIIINGQIGREVILDYQIRTGILAATASPRQRVSADDPTENKMTKDMKDSMEITRTRFLLVDLAFPEQDLYLPAHIPK